MSNFEKTLKKIKMLRRQKHTKVGISTFGRLHEVKLAEEGSQTCCVVIGVICSVFDMQTSYQTTVKEILNEGSAREELAEQFDQFGKW